MHHAHDGKLREEDAERLLGALAGVVSAHIITDGAGRLLEIHVLATPDLHPKQVVRNVESALSAGLGIQVDRRIVSVAQIRSSTVNGSGLATEEHDGADDAISGAAAAVLDSIADRQPDARPASAAADERLEYVRYESHRDEELCRCQVLLRSAAGEVTGTGTGPDTAGGRAEAAARAVFDALTKARPDLRIRLDGAVISQARGRSFVIISANVVLDRATIPLAGAAILSRSPEEAAILAALQASNRWSA
jgi:hypothetical protein